MPFEIGPTKSSGEHEDDETIPCQPDDPDVNGWSAYHRDGDGWLQWLSHHDTKELAEQAVASLEHNYTHPPDKYALAVEFARQLISELGGAKMFELRVRNAAEMDPTICHSHDFTDPNQILMDAWEKLAGSRCCFDPEDDQQMQFFNGAFSCAKRNRFKVFEIIVEALRHQPEATSQTVMVRFNVSLPTASLVIGEVAKLRTGEASQMGLPRGRNVPNIAAHESHFLVQSEYSDVRLHHPGDPFCECLDCTFKGSDAYQIATLQGDSKRCQQS